MSTRYDDAPIIYLMQKEYSTLTLTIKDSQGVVVPLTGATLQLTIKDAKTDTAYDITVLDASFDKTQEANGVISCPLTSTNLDLQGEYWGLLKITFSATNIKKGYFKIFVDSSEE